MAAFDIDDVHLLQLITEFWACRVSEWDMLSAEQENTGTSGYQDMSYIPIRGRLGDGETGISFFRGLLGVGTEYVSDAKTKASWSATIAHKKK